MKYFITILICLVVGFLIGFIPLSMKKAELKSQLDDCGDNLKNVYERLEISEARRIALHSFIGAYRAASDKNFGIARNRAIAGFDKGEILAEKSVDPYSELVSKRDEILSALAAGGKDAEPKMRLFLFSLYTGN